MKIRIKHRYTNDVIFEAECASVKLAIVKAVESGVALREANLADADLSNIFIKDGVFDGSSFDGSSFDGSSFDGSSFDGSSFVRSSFDGSSFVRSSFDGSSFVRSRFVRSRFVRSSFDGSSFDGSSFDGSSFDGTTARSLANAWSSAKADIWMTLLAASREVPGLLLALREGRVDGSQYEGECACLVGTIANLRHCKTVDLGSIRPDSNRPSERWFMAIQPGDTPEKSPITKITIEWIEEWQRIFAAAVKAEAEAAQ